MPAPEVKPAVEPAAKTTAAAFAAGLKAGAGSVFALVLTGAYISIGALAHDTGFSLLWVTVSTVLVWAAPAQVIIISSLGAGAAPLEAAIAVCLSGIRLLPMVVALLPVLKSARTRLHDLILPAHFTAVSVWVETLRLAPQWPRENRVAFGNGLGSGLMIVSLLATVVGYSLAAALPRIAVAAMLFLTPMSFLVSMLRANRLLSDRLAYVFGLVLGPVFAWQAIGLDLLWTALIGGSAAYAIHRLREKLR
jgi:predicted branched-subunit amino acid permease